MPLIAQAPLSRPLLLLCISRPPSPTAASSSRCPLPGHNCTQPITAQLSPVRGRVAKPQRALPGARYSLVARPVAVAVAVTTPTRARREARRLQEAGSASAIFLLPSSPEDQLTSP
ncbi:hypothetical protein DENSPDRAFT_883795 [Dentipellis sp. KUC8613]|nr:hypothetical protein DENSPDRAFT_883795 [Dentipellis sp. KUC8613]